MKKILVIIYIFFISCTHCLHQKKKLTFSDEMTFEQFKLKLNEYVKNNPYPNVNE